MMVAMVVIMLAGIAAGLAFTISRPDQQAGTRKTPSAIQIESTPPGAAVFAAGEPTGLRTPVTLTGITNKQLLIRLELPHYAPVTRTIDVLVGATASMRVALAPLQGRLIISDLPRSASLFLDDDEYMAGDVIATAAGKHVIRVMVGGRTLVQQSIDTTAGDQGLKFVPDKLVPD
jgi:hypothetical protein